MTTFQIKDLSNSELLDKLQQNSENKDSARSSEEFDSICEDITLLRLEIISRMK